MTQSKGSFTPGPWVVSRDRACDTLIRAKDAAAGQRIASTFASHATQANAETRLARIRENEANARLIAAAPALLEALKRTTELLANANRSTDRPSETVWRAVTEARSAIQSATGEG